WDEPVVDEVANPEGHKGPVHRGGQQHDLEGVRLEDGHGIEHVTPLIYLGVPNQPAPPAKEPLARGGAAHPAASTRGRRGGGAGATFSGVVWRMEGSSRIKSGTWSGWSGCFFHACACLSISSNTASLQAASACTCGEFRVESIARWSARPC